MRGVCRMTFEQFKNWAKNEDTGLIVMTGGQGVMALSCEVTIEELNRIFSFIRCGRTYSAQTLPQLAEELQNTTHTEEGYLSSEVWMEGDTLHYMTISGRRILVFPSLHEKFMFCVWFGEDGSSVFASELLKLLLNTPIEVGAKGYV